MIRTIRWRTIATTSAVVALIGGLLFVLFPAWLPWRTTLRLVGSIPFLFIIPGWCLTRALLPATTRGERVLLAPLFSTIAVTVLLYVVEETTLRMTTSHIIATIAGVNAVAIACAIIRARCEAACASFVRAHLHHKLDEHPEEQCEDRPDAAEDHECL